MSATFKKSIAQSFLVLLGLLVLGLATINYLFNSEKNIIKTLNSENESTNNSENHAAADINRETKNIVSSELTSFSLGSDDEIQGRLADANLKVKSSIELISAEAQLQRQDKFIDKIGSGLSTMLNTPITSIVGYAQIIRKKYLPLVEDKNNFQSYLFNIENESRRIKSLLASLSDYSKMELQTISEIEVDEFLEQILLSYKTRAELEGVYIFKEINSNKSINVNQELFKKIFVQILDNAFEALELSHKKEIYVAFENTVLGAKLIIKDSGEGIDTKSLKNVFDPFFTTKDFEDHDGLGLAYGLKAAKLMDIKLKISSELNVGTELILEFVNTNENVLTLCENSLDDLQEESRPEVEL